MTSNGPARPTSLSTDTMGPPKSNPKTPLSPLKTPGYGSIRSRTRPSTDNMRTPQNESWKSLCSSRQSRPRRDSGVYGSHTSLDKHHEVDQSLGDSPLQPRRASITTTNKLSYRRWCISTPTPDKLRERENTFVNDAIVVERRRTKYRDVLPAYSAPADPYCQMYFKKPDVQRLLSVTHPDVIPAGYLQKTSRRDRDSSTDRNFQKHAVLPKIC